MIASWRVRLVGATAALTPAGSRSPVIFAFWHSSLIPCGAALHRRLVAGGRPVSALVSRSGDGELVARAARDFGFDTVRGSTSRGGFVALRNLRRVLVQQRQSVLIAPDGPRGPARVVKAGVVQLASVTGVPIVPMAASAPSAWRASSWDRTVMPYPFSRVTIAVGETEFFDREASADEGAALLAVRMSELEARADSATRGRSQRGQSK